jgi:dinuclear metal center YbgI/SA1388 family protein
MINRNELVSYANNYLKINDFHDYCPNGLQIEGQDNITKIVSGVTACQDLINAAIHAEADMLLVHHGFFWKNEQPEITGIKKHRIKMLLDHDINLVAYHLPLDGHPDVGNNKQLANLLGIETKGNFGDGNLAIWGELAKNSNAQLPTLLANVLGRTPLHIDVEKPIKTVGICTGAAQGYIGRAAEMGLDAFISGEISEATWHIARESGIHYFAAGHHATERYGVQALAEHLTEKYSLQHEFIDIANPV